MKRKQRSAVVGFMSMLSLLQIPMSGASPVNWTTNADGFWDVTANWSSNPALPGVADDATLDVGAALVRTITHRSGTDTINSLTSQEILLINGSGSLTVSGAYTNVANTTVTNALLTLNGASALATYNQSAGTLTGTGTTTISGASTWTGGTQSGAGTTNFNGGVAVSGALNKTISGNRVINTIGTTTWSGNTSLSGNQILVNGSTINNSGTWNDTNAFSTQLGVLASGSNVFNNSGAYNKQGNSTTTIDSTFNNTGTVDVQTGTLSLLGGGTSDASFNMVSGATLAFGGGTHNLNSITTTGTGRFQVTGANTNAILTGTTTHGGELSVTGGTLTVNDNFNSASFNQSAGTLTGTGTTTISGASNWTSGTQSGAGTTNFNGGVAVSGALNKTISGNRVINTIGTTTWSGNTSLSGNQILVNGSTINNSGTWNDTNAFSTQLGVLASGSNVFNNSGAYNKQGNSTTTIDSTFNNTGTVDVQAGTLRLTNNFTNQGLINVDSGAIFGNSTQSTLMNGASGRLEGTGTLDPFGTNDLVNQGIVAPGKGGIGNLTIAGDYAQAASGILDIEIGGLSSVDTLSISGNSIFGGTLKVSSFGGFQPSVDDIFTLVLFSGTGSGAFDFLDTSAFSGLNFAAVYGTNDVQLRVTSAVPLPAAVWLMGSALMGMLYVSRQRRLGI
ncbi:MAG: hypothetical protein HOP23_12330 [Methylococcaceae bacterium]|nr:hypothetical protein [Methylococcaceae bacterium]